MRRRDKGRERWKERERERELILIEQQRERSNGPVSIKCTIRQVYLNVHGVIHRFPKVD